MPSWLQRGKLYIIIIIIIIIVVVIIKWHQTLSLKIYNVRWPQTVVWNERAVKNEH